MALPRYEGPLEEEDFDEEAPANVIHINDEIMDRLRAALLQNPDPEPETAEQEPPPTEHYRHPMLNVGFWCSFIAFIVLMVTTSSFIQYNILEPLVYAGMFFNLMAMLFNLTRDRTHVSVTRRPIVLNLRIGWPDFGPPIPLRERQLQHGIKPVDHNA